VGARVQEGVQLLDRPEIAQEKLYVHVGTVPKLMDIIEAELQIIFDRC